MNVCPVCRNVNVLDATVCRFCRSALTPPPPPQAVAPASPASRRWPWFAGAGALLLLLVIGGGVLFGGGGGGGAAQAAGVAIEVGTGTGPSLDFVPETVQAPRETPIVITFVNASTVPHNLTFEGGNYGATDPNVAPQASDTVEFTTPASGALKFVCTIHPGMEGELVVQ